jgi:hypothetical protein
MTKRLEGTEKVAGLDVVKEYSYATARPSGEGWVLVGDSWGFIDPIYSSGVWFALKSGPLAADAIIEGLKASKMATLRASSSANGSPTSAAAPHGSGSSPKPGTAASSASANSSANILSTWAR